MYPAFGDGSVRWEDGWMGMCILLSYTPKWYGVLLSSIVKFKMAMLRYCLVVRRIKEGTPNVTPPNY